jgi:hypothetical protein
MPEERSGRASGVIFLIRNRNARRRLNVCVGQT